MFGRIISLLPGSPFSDIRSMVEEKQHAYPKNWFYKPIGIEVEITNKCNLKCAGCGQRDETIRPEDILTTEDYIDIILQASNTPIFACSITGGETLLFLERVKQILQAVTGQIDIYKINSNSYRFVTQQVTLQVLEQLKAAGFGQKNHTIKSVLVTSIGQQNENGMPLKNSVNLVSAFYKVFDFDSALVTVNATDQNMQKAQQWLKAFQELYTQVTGSAVDEQRVPFRAFMLNNVPTLERLQLMIDYQVPIQDLIDSFKQQYVSWKCLNMLPVDPENELTTLTPRCVLRPNGDLYACPGYNYTHKLGNLREHTLQQLIEMANHNPLLESVFREGLSGLLKYAAKIDPSLKKEKLSLSYAPCDVCQHLSNIVRTYQQV
jgi:sulfatase maturation enzyme AslB (radical SAM superfamily)